MDKLTRDQRKKCMSRIRAKDTKPEIALRKALWKKGVRYRKNVRSLPGTPDIVIAGRKIAIFVDGDFWHARGHRENPGEEVATHQSFWRQKLARNVERDRDVNDALTEMGWLVLRFWASDVEKHTEHVVDEICAYL